MTFRIYAYYLPVVLKKTNDTFESVGEEDQPKSNVKYTCQ